MCRNGVSRSGCFVSLWPRKTLDLSATPLLPRRRVIPGHYFINFCFLNARSAHYCRHDEWAIGCVLSPPTLCDMDSDNCGGSCNSSDDTTTLPEDVASESRDQADYQFLVGMQINDEDGLVYAFDFPQGLYRGVSSAGNYSGLHVKEKINSDSHSKCGPQRLSPPA